MPIELLMELAAKQLPLVITNPDLVDQLRVLSAAELVVVKLPDGDAEQLRAEVVEITEKGMRALSAG